jgi:alpha-tubulin suppressor-like RCC1 family protein
MAIDSEGQLWAWGSNSQCRAGLPEAIETIAEPTKVLCFEELKLQAVKVSCGKNHTLVLAKDQ